jgi:hypothetical protein
VLAWEGSGSRPHSEAPMTLKLLEMWRWAFWTLGSLMKVGLKLGNTECDCEGAVDQLTTAFLVNFNPFDCHCRRRRPTITGG